MRHYLITAGTFKRDDGTIAATGDHIELPADLATQFANQLQACDTPAAPADPEHHE